MPTIRISDKGHRMLRDMAAQAGESMQSVLERALETHRRRQLLEATNRAYAALRSDPKAWTEEQEERRAWEATLGDDLEHE